MFGVLLAGISSAFDEIAASIGKKKIADGLESYYTYGFLTHFLSALLMTALGFFFSAFTFSLDSLPTFVPRVMVAIVQLQLMVIGLSMVDRGSFGFLRVATIPLLLGADIALGYVLTGAQVTGIIMILIAIGSLFYFEYSKGQMKGMLIVLCGAILAAADLSLYKWDITHFNSVASEQSIIQLILAMYFFLAAVLIRRENPLSFLRERIYMAQAGSSGVAYVVNSFAYVFAPASVIATAFRAFSVLFAVLSGTLYFKEADIRLRVFLFGVVLIGLVLLAQVP